MSIRSLVDHLAGLLPGRREPGFAAPVSQLVSESQFHCPRFQYWRQAFRMRPGLNRKLWEYLYIANALDHTIGLRDGVRVLGFGVGRERLPAVLAARGCAVTATDFAEAGAWAARSLEDLMRPDDGAEDPHLAHLPICDAERFRALVQYRSVDMNAIPQDLRGYDCLWSCGSLEHIGGLENGLTFVERAMACLRPGGVAVHTTEFNLSSNDVTYESPEMSFYRRRDIEGLADRLRAGGHRLTLNLTRGTGPIDNHVDKPPFDYDLTMNALVCGYLITSVGLIIRKAGWH